METDWTTYLLQMLPLGATLVGLVACLIMSWRRRHAGYLLGTLGFGLAAAGIGVNLYAGRLPRIWRAAGVSLEAIGWRLAGYQLLIMLLAAAGYLLLLAALAVAGARPRQQPGPAQPEFRPPSGTPDQPVTGQPGAGTAPRWPTAGDG